MEDREALIRKIEEQNASIETMKQKTKDFVSKLKLEHQASYKTLQDDYLKAIDASQKLAEENEKLSTFIDQIKGNTYLKSLILEIYVSILEFYLCFGIAPQQPIIKFHFSNLMQKRRFH